MIKKDATTQRSLNLHNGDNDLRAAAGGTSTFLCYSSQRRRRSSSYVYNLFNKGTNFHSWWRADPFSLCPGDIYITITF